MIKTHVPYVIEACFPYMIKTAEDLDVTLDNLAGLHR